MSTTVFTLKKFYERDLVIRDDDTGEPVTIPLRLRRLSVGEMNVFRAGFDRVMSPRSVRYIYRKPEGDEQEKELRGETEVFVVADDEVARRRLAEMTPETRAEYERLQAEDNQHLAEFSSSAIAEHVWVKPGNVVNVEDNDGTVKAVTSGAELADVLAGNLVVRGVLLGMIFEVNTLTAAQKKTSRPLSGLNSSSPKPSGEGAVAGARPDATVANAGSGGSAPSAGVSAAQGQSQSGSTATA